MQQLRECQSSKTVALVRDCQQVEPPPSVAEINLTAFKPEKVLRVFDRKLEAQECTWMYILEQFFCAWVEAISTLKYFYRSLLKSL